MPQKARLAKALTKSYHQMGAPTLMVLPCYVIPLIVLILTGFLWELFIPGVIIHIFMAVKFRKDEYWFKNHIDALKEDQHLEP